MAVSLDKIVQMQQSVVDMDKMKNPFENWLKLKSNGTSYDNYVTGLHSELNDNDNSGMIGSNSSIDGNVITHVGRQANQFLHLAVSSPLIFFAFLAICVALLILFERQSRRGDAIKKRNQRTSYHSNCSEGTAEVLVIKSEPVLNISPSHIRNMNDHEQNRSNLMSADKDERNSECEVDIESNV